MALIENKSSRKSIILRPHHVFGRQPLNTDTRLKTPDTSNIHATIRWNMGVWTIKDHSRNGTWLDQQRITKDGETELVAGQTFCFGTNKNNSWQIKNLDKPIDMLISLSDHQNDIPLHRFCVLPDESNPEISIYWTETGQWECEHSDKNNTISHGDILSIKDGRQWQLSLPSQSELTVTTSITDLREKKQPDFNFDISSDEEHIKLIVNLDKIEYDLSERTHHYLLLILARQRVLDASKGIIETDQGWLYMDDLEKMLGLTLNHINIQIYRARKQMEKTFERYHFTPQLFERRRGCIRFTFPASSVTL